MHQSTENPTTGTTTTPAPRASPPHPAAAAEHPEREDPMAPHTMNTAEFAIIQHRLGMRLADIAQQVGVGLRAVVRWADATPNSPGAEATTKLRSLIAQRDELLAAEVAKLHARKSRPVVLERHATQEALVSAGSPHVSVGAQDAFLAELTVALERKHIECVIVSAEV